jgi:pimeloyl-ACP methyl ester carboxylesterase
VSGAAVRRGFVEIDEGQVHYRCAGAGGRPLVMLHASPGSSRGLVPLLRELGTARRVVALDTLGNGDSAAPAPAAPDIAYFADAHRRAIDALGIDGFDLYGGHTGGNIACEIAIAAPGRVRRLVLDGMSAYDPDEQRDLLANYAREIPIDLEGSQFFRVWNFVRDAYLFWPWYKRDAAHVRDVGLPPAAVLHDKAVEVLKALGTYHLSYRAALAYDKTARLPLVRTPTLLMCARNDMLLRYVDKVHALLPDAAPVLTPGANTTEAAAETAGIIAEWLDRPDSDFRSPAQ